MHDLSDQLVDRNVLERRNKLFRGGRNRRDLWILLGQASQFHGRPGIEIQRHFELPGHQALQLELCPKTPVDEGLELRRTRLEPRLSARDFPKSTGLDVEEHRR